MQFFTPWFKSNFSLMDASEWYQQRLITGMDGGFVQEFHNRTYGPNFSYANFASMFKVGGTFVCAITNLRFSSSSSSLPAHSSVLSG